MTIRGVKNKLSKSFIKREESIKNSKIIGHNIINSTEGRMKKWMITIVI